MGSAKVWTGTEWEYIAVGPQGPPGPPGPPGGGAAGPATYQVVPPDGSWAGPAGLASTSRIRPWSD